MLLGRRGSFTRRQSVGVVTFASGFSGTALTLRAALRPRSTGPPLSILSWCVDGSERTHHRCRRRLRMAQRVPLIAETIRGAAPDVVALQDSTPELAAALCAGEGGQQTDGLSSPSSLSSPQLVVVHGTMAEWLQSQQRKRTNAVTDSAASVAASASREGTAETSLSSSSSSSASPPIESGEEQEGEESSAAAPQALPQQSPHVRYDIIGTTRNGNSGEVQLFVRSDSQWRARLCPTAVGVTAELSWHDPADRETGERAEATAKAPLRIVLTALDLTYRGKSVADSGRLLTSADVSRDGSPLTLHTPESSMATAAADSRRSRVKGQLDAHREVALNYVARVAQPDVLVGNFFMGRSETMPGYEDAWVLSGTPAKQELTSNTTVSARRGGRPERHNYFYFVPSPGGGGGTAEGRATANNNSNKTKKQRAQTAEESSGENGSPTTEHVAGGPNMDGQVTSHASAASSEVGTTATTTTTASPSRSGNRDNNGDDDETVVEEASAPIGTPLPLHAQRTAAGAWVTSPAAEVGAATSASLLMRAGVKTEDLTCETDRWLAKQLCGTSDTSRCAAATAAGYDGGATQPREDPVRLIGPLGVPQVAGRFQRCFFRRNHLPSRTHSGHFSFVQRYDRRSGGGGCRVVVLRPFVKAPLGPLEEHWHTEQGVLHHRVVHDGEGNASGDVRSQGKQEAREDQHDSSDGGNEWLGEKGKASASSAGLDSRAGGSSSSSAPRLVNCSLSDQFPLLTLLM